MLGIADGANFGGGVTAPSFIEPALSYSAAIFAAVGVLSGSKFSGGRRKGCNVLLLTVDVPLGFRSVPEHSSIVRSLGRSLSSFVIPFSTELEGVPSAVEPLVVLPVSKGKLDFRTEK